MIHVWILLQKSNVIVERRAAMAFHMAQGLGRDCGHEGTALAARPLQLKVRVHPRLAPVTELSNAPFARPEHRAHRHRQ